MKKQVILMPKSPLRESGDKWLRGSSAVGCMGQEAAPGFWHKAA